MTLYSPSKGNGFRLDPPTYHPPSLSTQGGEGETQPPSVPFYTPPPNSNIVRRVKTTRESLTAAQVPHVEVEAEPDLSEPFESMPIVKVSNKIHILGFNPHARFTAHALASVISLPAVQMLTHHIRSMVAWGQEGRTVRIHDSQGIPISSRPIPCPEYIHHLHPRKWTSPPILDNIIVSTATRAVLPSLAYLRHFIDRRTTVCLLEPGLGIMENLNEKLFKSPASRPNYVICHSDHMFARVSSSHYSLKHVPGKLLLYAVPRDDDGADLDPGMAEWLGSQHTSHVIKLLSTAGDLNAVGLPWHVFLRQKLPSMVFQSLADTISVILGCRFNQIRDDSFVMDFWDRLTEETINIVTSFPELRKHPKELEYFMKDSFPKKLKKKLDRQGVGYSRWISMVRMGQMPPIDYFNGYFVRRAKELGLEHKLNSQVISLAKGRQTSRWKELKLDIPLGFLPYIQDSDKIGGGQYKYDPYLDVEVDF
ncbi:hypothetical protein F4804DRAFT_302599 [Jackrogersella minutella]|nr:hypothetical protein F4804DRAFT_302599 [Jackrogersella minutella]